MYQAYSIREPIPNTIVILRALQLGDMMCAIPAFRALRHALPEAQITLVGLPWAQEFVHRYKHYLDDFIEFPGYPGFPEIPPKIHGFPDFLSEIQARHYDLGIQMQGSGNQSNSLTVLFGARHNAGFFLSEQYCPDEARFLPYPVHEPEVMRHLRLMEFLGAPMQGTQLEFPISDEEWKVQKEILDANKLTPGDYLCIHPGARAPERRWSPEKFAQVADGLSQKGYKIVLTGGKEEAAITNQVAHFMRSESIDLAGKTSLGVLGALLTQSRLLISNDTGVSHLASALNVPSVILFLASDPRRWAPLNRTLHRGISWADAITPQVVLFDAEDLLQEERTYAV